MHRLHVGYLEKGRWTNSSKRVLEFQPIFNVWQYGIHFSFFLTTPSIAINSRFSNKNITDSRFLQHIETWNCKCLLQLLHKMSGFSDFMLQELYLEFQANTWKDFRSNTAKPPSIGGGWFIIWNHPFLQTTIASIHHKKTFKSYCISYELIVLRLYKISNTKHKVRIKFPLTKMTWHLGGAVVGKPFYWELQQIKVSVTAVI